MRSIFLVLAYSAVSHAAECSADESTMLQMRKAQIKKHSGNAQAVLKSVRTIASSMVKGSSTKLSTDNVDQALADAAAALATLTPALQLQVTQSQQQIDDAAAAVNVCHAQDGYVTRATLLEQTTTTATSLQSCLDELAQLTQAATDQCNIAQDCLCDEANVRRDDKSELCAARTEVYELAYCEHSIACTTFGDCHDSEIAVYNALRTDVEAEMATVTQEYIAATQSQCLTDLITTAISTGTPIDLTAMTNCNNVDTSGLYINYPTLPAAPAACPAAAVGNPQCAGALIQLKYANPSVGSDGMCVSMSQMRSGAGCDATSCLNNGASDATFQVCDSTDSGQLFAWDETNGQLVSAMSGNRCLHVGTSSTHGSCEPFTLEACDSSNTRQQFTQESVSGATVFRNTATNLAIDSDSYRNTVNNWIWACPGTNTAKYFNTPSA